MNAAATQLADKLLHKHQKHVIVFDFYNSDGSLTALGPKLADGFSKTLSKANKHLRVKKRSDLHRLVSKDHFDPTALKIHALEGRLAEALNLKTYVDGTISRDGNSLTITVKARQPSDRKPTASATYSVPITPGTESLLNQLIAPAPDPPFFEPGMKGYSHPNCVYCPRADYSRRALGHKTQGVVVLDAIVTTDGRLAEIRVLKRLPDGLTENCLRAARSWKLTPGKRPNGQPVALREVLEFWFQPLR